MISESRNYKEKKIHVIIVTVKRSRLLPNFNMYISYLFRFRCIFFSKYCSSPIVWISKRTLQYGRVALKTCITHLSENIIIVIVELVIFVLWVWMFLTNTLFFFKFFWMKNLRGKNYTEYLMSWNLFKTKIKYGKFHTLFKNLLEDDRKFFQYFRMSCEKFNELLDII